MSSTSFRRGFEAARKAGRDSLDEPGGKALVEAFGLPVPRSRTARDPDEAARACAALSAPYAVKIWTAGAAHKSDHGGVRLHLAGPDEVRAAAREILASWPGDREPVEGLLVEEMIAPGHELVVGGYRDPQFGPMIMVGLGGTFVEIYADVSFRVCPIEKRDAEQMLAELRAYPVLCGSRGGKSVDREALVDAILKVGGAHGILMELADEIEELDINPLIAGPHGVCAADVRITLAPQHPSRRTAPPPPAPDFGPLFAPRNIAVAGVSTSGGGAGNRFIRNLEALGFGGDIYPVHPSAGHIDGRRAYPSFAQLPQDVDYAYIAAPRPAVAGLLRQAGGKLRFAHIMTSGFGEGGRHPEQVRELIDAMHAGGMRVLGPNCLGIHTPRAKVSFTQADPARNLPGHVGVISQSGGFGIDMVRYGQARGLRFSSIVTIGNSIDIGASDLLEYFVQDPSTRVIGLYLESVDQGRRFFETLVRARAAKPVVILKGGRTGQGQKAAMSHTGSLVGDARVWNAVAAQTGCMLVDTIEELIETLLLFQTMAPNLARPTRRLILFGNGGGAGVVASDRYADAGFSLAEFSPETADRLHALELPDGASDSNPIDVPGNVFDRTQGKVAADILGALRDDPNTDMIVVHLNLPVLLGYRGRRIAEHIVDACLDYRRSAHHGVRLALVLRSDGERETEEARRVQRERAIAAGIPAFDNFAMAARCLSAMASFESFHQWAARAATSGRDANQHGARPSPGIPASLEGGIPGT